MKIKFASPLLVLALVLRAFAANEEAVQWLQLDFNSVTHVPVAVNGPTTLRFPGPISDIEGAHISSDASSTASFVISFRPGSSFFSIRAQTLSEKATMNVVCREQTYVFELQGSRDPWLSVILVPSGTAIPRPKVLSAERAMRLLEMAKSATDATNRLPTSATETERWLSGRVDDYGDLAVRTIAISHVPADNALVFHLLLTNKTDHSIQYLPESFMIKSSRGVLYETTNDASGIILPSKNETVYLVVGLPPAGKPVFSSHDEFMVLVNRLAASNQAAVVQPAPASTAGPGRSPIIQSAGLVPTVPIVTSPINQSAPPSSPAYVLAPPAQYGQPSPIYVVRNYSPAGQAYYYYAQPNGVICGGQRREWSIGWGDFKLISFFYERDR